MGCLLRCVFNRAWFVFLASLVLVGSFSKGSLGPWPCGGKERYCLRLLGVCMHDGRVVDLGLEWWIGALFGDLVPDLC